MLTINQKIHNFLEHHKNKRISIVIFLILSVFVIIGIISGLTKTAVSMMGDLTCNIEEHSHTDECYSKVLICGMTEATGHIHNENCYDDDKILICGLEENEEHTHTDECYEIEYTLKCTEPESESHVHTDKCYELKRTCGKTEHKHNEKCYNAENNNQENQRISERIENISLSSPLEGGVLFYADESGSDIVTDVSVNFGVHISNVSYQEITSGSTDENIKPVKFTLNYLLPANTLMQENNNRQIYYKLPDNVIITEVKNGNVMKEGQKIGTYAITGDGYIVIDFDQNFVKDGTSEISGDITFNANVKRTDSSSEKETVTIGNISVDIDFSKNTEQKSDLSVNKSHSDYNADTSSITYNIDITTVNGTGDGNITITDFLVNTDSSLINLNISDGDTINIIKKDSDGSSQIIQSTVSMSSDGKAVIAGLPALAAGESYSLEYTALLTPGNVPKLIKTDNKVVVTNGTITDEYTDYGQVATGCILTKTGSYNEKTDNISWEITILNPMSASLSGYTVTDEMLSSTIEGTLKVFDENNNEVLDPGTLDESTNTFSFGDLNGKKYRLVYQTKSPDHGTTITNKASLKNGDQEINSDQGDAYVGNDRQYISKNDSGKGYNDDGNVLIDWNIKLEFQAGDFNGKIYTDTMRADTEHYMIPQQIGELAVSGTTPEYANIDLAEGTDYNLTCFDKEGNEITDLTDESVKIYSFKIEFKDNENISKLCDVKISYESVGLIDSDMNVGDSMLFYNKAEFDGIITEPSYKETKKASIRKFDAINGSIDNTEHKTSELEKAENGDYILKWYVIANESNNYGNSDITLTDTLPKGVSLIESSVIFKKYNGSYYEDSSGMDFSVTETENGVQQIEFIIPFSVHDGNSVRIDYSASVPESFIRENKSGTYTSFTNVISDGANSAEQTQNIHFPLISKSGSDPAETYDGYIEYYIDVNPYGEKLSNTGKIIVTDSLRHFPNKDENGNFVYSWGCTATLIRFNVYKVTTDSSGKETLSELDPTQYKMTYMDVDDYFGKLAKITSELPDEMHLKIQYTYLLVYNEPDSHYIGETFNAQNDAVIDYGSGTQTSHYENQYDLQKDSGAHAVTSDYIKIYKIDSENYALKLGGAVFNLYKWENGQWLPLVNETPSADGGVQAEWGGTSDAPKDIITSSGGDYRLPALDQSVVYKLVEISAPENYIKRKDPFYFTLNKIPSVLPDGVNSSEITLMLKGGIINLENTKRQEVEVQVNKHWSGSSKQEVEIELYKSKTLPSSGSGAVITLNISDNNGNTFDKKFIVNKKEDVVLSLRSLDSYLHYGSYIKLNGVEISIPNSTQEEWGGNGNWDDTDWDNRKYSEWLVSLGVITEDANVEIYFSNSQSYSKYDILDVNGVCTEMTGSEPPSEINEIKIPDDAVKIGDTAVLNDSQGWSYTWRNLEMTDDVGNPYYYYVKELTAITGYTAEYDTNGVNGGIVNLTNREEGHINTIPSTGGIGIRRFIVFGLIIMIIPIGCYYLNKRRQQRKY